MDRVPQLIFTHALYIYIQPCHSNDTDVCILVWDVCNNMVKLLSVAFKHFSHLLCTILKTDLQHLILNIF